MECEFYCGGPIFQPKKMSNFLVIFPGRVVTGRIGVRSVRVVEEGIGSKGFFFTVLVVFFLILLKAHVGRTNFVFVAPCNF